MERHEIILLCSSINEQDPGCGAPLRQGTLNKSLGENRARGNTDKNNIFLFLLLIKH